MDCLIPLVNKLQAILSSVPAATASIDLPQIAVVGSQSSGKSSCIEQIVCKDFLPKGQGIVTRCPLVLQLIRIEQRSPPLFSEDGQSTSKSESTFYSPAVSKTPNGVASRASDHGTCPEFKPNVAGEKKSEASLEPVDAEYAEFQHLPEKRFYDFNDVRAEIMRQTSVLAGDNKSVSKTPIILRIYSTKVLPLTLVDLPGLTKIPVGDQPSDIEIQIRNMVATYIGNPNCLILAITPANIDIANSDALKLAREFDPLGKRTLGVLTKLDLTESESHALDILLGKVYPLQHGFVAIVNRTQKEIAGGRSLEQARIAEQNFFASHPVYYSLSSSCGVPFLARKLNGLLIKSIQSKLPELRARLNFLISIKQTELEKFGDPGVAPRQTPEGIVLRLITQYASAFACTVEGSMPQSAVKPMLSSGARLYEIFESEFRSKLDHLDPCNDLSYDEISIAIRNCTGSRPSLFLPEAAFDVLVKPQIRKLREPALHCVQCVYETLLHTTHDCFSAELSRYPFLKRRIINVTADLLKECLEPTTKFINSLVEIQCAYINTNHPDFIGGANAIAKLERAFNEQNQKRASIDRMRRLASGAGRHAISEAFTIKPREHIYDYLFKAGSDISSRNTSSSDILGTSRTSSAVGRSSNLASLDALSLDDRRTVQDEVQAASSVAASLVEPESPSGLSKQKQQKLAPNVPPTSASASASATTLASGDDGALSVVSGTLSREDFAVELIRCLLSSYYAIVKKMLSDSVPKATMHFLVNECKDQMHNRLVQALYRESELAELVQEDQQIVAERQSCVQLLRVYRSALDAIMNLASS